MLSCSDFIQSVWSEEGRKSLCVVARWKRERPHILRGQKGCINTPCDEVNKLISVLFPGEERGFCWSATMTPLWLILPNAIYKFDWRTSTVLSDSSLIALFWSGNCRVCTPHSFCSLAHLFMWVSSYKKKKNTQTHTHMFMQATQNTQILLGKTACLSCTVVENVISKSFTSCPTMRSWTSNYRLCLWEEHQNLRRD